MACPGLLSRKYEIKIINLKNWQDFVKKSPDIHRFLQYPLTDKKSHDNLRYLKVLSTLMVIYAK